MLPIGRTTSTWSDCGCPALRGEVYSFHVARCPVRFKRRQRVRRLAKLVVMGIAGGLVAAWLYACAVGSVERNGTHIIGVALGHAKLEAGDCALPTPATTPAATPVIPAPNVTPGTYARIEGGALSSGVVELLSNAVTGTVAYFTAN